MENIAELIQNAGVKELDDGSVELILHFGEEQSEEEAERIKEFVYKAFMAGIENGRKENEV